jgi:hypothetical protein
MLGEVMIKDARNIEDPSIKDFETTANALEDLQISLEPIRDKALDQRAYFSGYAQCAEDMIKVIAGRIQSIRDAVKLKKNNITTEEVEKVAVTTNEDGLIKDNVASMEPPLIVDGKKKIKKKKNTAATTISG